jgi:choice-of-anchor B domain-containing protein
VSAAGSFFPQRKIVERSDDMNSIRASCLIAMAVVLSSPAAGQTSRNMSLFGTLNPIPVRYSGCWGWTSPSGAEYALLGGFEGTHIIAIDDSLNIHEVDFVDGQNSNWREMTVIGDHAYVVTEGGGDLQGMQVIDLSPLPDSVRLATTYTQTFTRAHIIARDEYSASPIVYVSGTSTTSGVHFLDVSNPEVPVEIGLYDPPYYIHDAHVHGDLLFASALSVGLDIVDISDKSSPVMIGQIDHSSQFTHSAWTTEDLSHIVVTDEIDGLPSRIWNIEDLQNPVEVAQYSANLASLVHNPYILGNLVFLSHNTEGIRVVDIADPSLPVEVGFYDTYPGPSGGFNGLWSGYPFFPSGKIIGGNREDGLYVWRFNGTRAGRIYGEVVDLVSGEPVSGAAISIVETGSSTSSGIDGSFRIGELPSGDPGYTIEVVGPPGYEPTEISSFVLQGGDSLWLQVLLSPSISSAGEFDEPATAGTRLARNHPNPFNGVTNFDFPVADAGLVSLRIYDLIGREVATLVDEPLPSGTHTRRWDAAGLPSGVYLYTFTAPHSPHQTGKLLLLR